MRAGSPPKLAMFCCTHLKAASWSQRPAFPLASAEPAGGNKTQLKTLKVGINVTFLAALADETWQNWYQSLKVWSLPRWSLYTVTPFQFLVFHRAALGVLLCPSDRKITLELLSLIRAHHSRRQIQAQISIDLASRFFFYISSLTLKWVTSKTNKQKNLCVCQVLKLEGVYKNYCFPGVHLILCFLPTYLLHLPCLTNHKS